MLLQDLTLNHLKTTTYVGTKKNLSTTHSCIVTLLILFGILFMKRCGISWCMARDFSKLTEAKDMALFEGGGLIFGG